MLAKEQALQFFTQAGALLEGHFRLTSGRHSNQYMQCAQGLEIPGLYRRTGPPSGRGLQR